MPNAAADTATFGVSSGTSVTVSANAQVSGITFTADANAFTVTTTPAVTLTLGGVGLANNSAVTQKFVTAVDGSGGAGSVIFTNGATAGSNVAFTNSGTTVFLGAGGSTRFGGTSSADNGTFTNNGAAFSSGNFATVGTGGSTQFAGNATAGSGTFINNAGTVFGAYGGSAQFFDSATAGHGVFANNGALVSGGAGGGATYFNNASSADNGTFANKPGLSDSAAGGQINFYDTATGGNGSFANSPAAVSGARPGSINFYNSATAGAGVFLNRAPSELNNGVLSPGSISFYNTASAGNATFTNEGATGNGLGGGIYFHNGATAANGSFTNNGSPVGMVAINYRGAPGSGWIQFLEDATAGSAAITNNGTVVGDGTGAITWFIDRADAGGATVINNGGTVDGAAGGRTEFFNNATAGHSILIANGGAGLGGAVSFQDDSTGSTARVKLYGNGYLSLDRHKAPGLTVGSIEGSGMIYLSGLKLTAGINDGSTTFTGPIYDDGPTAAATLGALVKVGSGTLTLSGANLYTGGTTISAGAILANNLSGSALGTGAVLVASGATLGGNGLIGGLTAVASGGRVAPGNVVGTLTFAKGLTLANGAILDFQLGSSSDRVDVTGDSLTLPSGTGSVTVNLANSGGFVPGVPYTLLNFVGGQTSGLTVSVFSLGKLVGVTLAADYTLSLTATSLVLTYSGDASKIPEPPPSVAPTITSAASLSVTGGQPMNFTVTATGTPAPTFSATGLPAWAALNPTTGVLNGTPPDATGSPFKVTLTVSNGVAPNATQSFTLTVRIATVAPLITTQPVSQTTTVGGDASFSAAASGVPPPTYQWQVSTNGGSNWTNVVSGGVYSGATALKMSLTGATSAMNGYLYRCVASNGSGPAATTAATTLTVGKVAQAITFAAVGDKTTADAPFALSASATSGLPVSFSVVSGPATLSGNTVSITSDGTVVLRASQAGDSTYAPAPVVECSFTIIPAHFAGTYFGTFPNNHGRWALKVNADNTAIYIAYLTARNSAVIVHLTIGADGSFTTTGTETVPLAVGASASALAMGSGGNRQVAATASSFTLTGQISSGAVSGQLTGIGETFTGAIDAAEGAAASGYYSAAALATASGTTYAIVAPSGQVLVVSVTATEVDGATGTIGGNGQLTATTVNGGQLALTLNASAQSLAATLTPAGATTPISFAGSADTVASTARLVNIATRAYCSTDNKVTIGGFVVSGRANKRVLVRAVGPSLTAQGIGVAEVLLDPTIEVHDAIHGNSIVATNDNWGDNVNAAEINAVASSVGASALLSSDTQSSAALLNLPPGVYSFVVNGKTATAGVVLLEVYDADAAMTGTTFANIATRAYATTGNGVTIGGFVIAGNAPKHVLLRAVGPTLTKQGLGVAEVLTDPTIELHDALRDNAIVATNDNWGDNPNAASITTTGARIGATPFDGGDTKSAALLVTLQPGVYSFIVQGKSTAPSGIVLVEVYDAD